MNSKQNQFNTVVAAVSVLLAFGAGYAVSGARQANSSGWSPPSSPIARLIRTADGSMTAAVAGQDGKARAFKPDLKPYETLEEVRQAIKDNFVKTKVDDTELTYGAVRGMLHSLDDRFTRFLTPKEYAEFNERTSAEFVGIGAHISVKDDYRGGPQSKPFGSARPYIVKPIEGSPAAKAGLKPDDVILAVGNKNTADLSDEATVAAIKGVRGTKVKIKIERLIPSKDPKTIDHSRRDGSSDGTFQVLDLEITRDLIEMHPVNLQWLPNDVAWLRLDEFNRKSDEEVGKALKTVEDGHEGKAAKGLILDMRNNPGGLLDVAVDVGSRFIPSGPIVYTRERTGAEQALNAEPKRFMNLKLPIVVLINRYSASAAEIITGALKDKDVATVVGETTFGKASVQVVIELQNGGALIMTTAKYLTPSKTDISEKGITPDVAVQNSDEDDKNGRGAQLQKAVAIIEGKVETPKSAATVATATN